MQVRATPAADTVLLELTTENGRITIDGPAGRITLLVTDDDTTALTWVEGEYDLELVSPGSEVTRLLKGAITVTVETTPTCTLQLAPTGLQGPPGPAGPAGGDIIVYDRAGIPAAQWIITHNLGRLAHVTVVLDTGEEITTDVDQHDPNTCTVYFAAPTSGKALVG